MVAEALSSSGISVGDAAITFTGVVLLGFWREMNALRKQTLQWQSRIDTTLFGVSGHNGLNGTSKDHEERLRTLELRPHLLHPPA